MRQARALVPSEHDEQRTVIAWRDVMAPRYPDLRLLHASLNGVRLSQGQAAKAKRTGLSAGVPDLFLPVARHGWHGLWIEMKRQKGGRVSHEQRWWHHQLHAKGYSVVVARGAGQAIQALEGYLDIGRRVRAAAGDAA